MVFHLSVRDSHNFGLGDYLSPYGISMAADRGTYSALRSGHNLCRFFNYSQPHRENALGSSIATSSCGRHRSREFCFSAAGYYGLIAGWHWLASVLPKRRMIEHRALPKPSLQACFELKN
jgi:hypothetical protein